MRHRTATTSLNVGFQYPNQPDYTDAGKETYNIHDPALAKKYLAQSGYKGEPVVLLTDKDYPPMYNSALVMAEQLKAVGINAQLKVVDWPTSVQMCDERPTPAGTSSSPAGARSRRWARWRRCSSWRSRTPAISRRTARTIRTAGGLERHELRCPTDRSGRQAFARMQKLMLEGLCHAVRVADQGAGGARQRAGFMPFRIPRMSNVWLID